MVKKREAEKEENKVRETKTVKEKRKEIKEKNLERPKKSKNLKDSKNVEKIEKIERAENLKKPEKLENSEESKMSEGKDNLIHQVVWYMLIFSIIGLIIETIYGYVTTGILESRKGLILGPFCPIYGLGAVIIILMLNKYSGHKIKLFIYGGILGSFIEYLLSFILEAMYGSRFWSYANFMNLNGRICLLYTVFWGILSILLVDVVKKYIDKGINKIKGKARKIIDIILIVFFVIDMVLTIWGISVYKARAKDIYYEVKIFEEKNIFEKAGDAIFTDEIMSAIFPNLRLIDENENEIWIKDIINK